MSDLISRADAIEAVRKKLQDWGSYAFEDYRRGLYEAQDIIEALPSAELPKGDLISRADAIEEFREWVKRANENGETPTWNDAVSLIGSLPSADAKGGVISAEKLKRMKFVVIKGDKTEEAYRKGWNGAIECVIGEYASDEAVHKLDYSYEADMVKRLRQAEAVQGWIPCSERLPKAEDMYQPPEQRYLCQLEAYGERKFCVLSRLKGAVSPFWDWYGVAIHDSEVTAWMSLPKPYKGGDSE